MVSVPGSAIVPIFPLPDITFFPRTLLPLHVSRRAIVRGHGRARPRRPAGHREAPAGLRGRDAGKPAVHPVCGVGEIVLVGATGQRPLQHPRARDARVRIERELPSDTLYRLVSVRRLEDVGPAGTLAPRRSRASRGVARAARGARPAARPCSTRRWPRASPRAPVADRVAAAVLPDATLRQELLETLDVDARVARVADALETLVRELKAAAREARGGRRTGSCCCSHAGVCRRSGRGSWLGRRIRDLSSSAAAAAAPHERPPFQSRTSVSRRVGHAGDRRVHVERLEQLLAQGRVGQHGGATRSVDAPRAGPRQRRVEQVARPDERLEAARCDAARMRASAGANVAAGPHPSSRRTLTRR